MRLELVKDWMSRDVVTAVSTLGLLEADALMREHNIRRLPVVENGRLVGMVTYGDIREARPSDATSLSTWEMNYLLAGLSLAEIMTKQPKSILPDATIGEAADLMLTNRISGLPVTDENGNFWSELLLNQTFFAWLCINGARRRMNLPNRIRITRGIDHSASNKNC